jgi:hypothetical protein
VEVHEEHQEGEELAEDRGEVVVDSMGHRCRGLFRASICDCRDKMQLNILSAKPYLCCDRDIRSDSAWMRSATRRRCLFFGSRRQTT